MDDRDQEQRIRELAMDRLRKMKAAEEFTDGELVRAVKAMRERVRNELNQRDRGNDDE